MELYDANGKPLVISGDSACSEDASFIIFGIHSEPSGVVFTDADIASYRHYFERFRCVKVFLRSDAEQPTIDIRSIPDYRGIEDLAISVKDGATILIDEDRIGEFENLSKLVIHGAVPQGFPAFERLLALRELDIEYQPSSFDLWRNASGITDLMIRSYKELDLLPLCGLASLQRLCISGGRIRSLDGIRQFPQLHTLFIVYTRSLKDLHAIVESKSLRNIRFESYKVNTDWTFLADKTDWEIISIEAAQSIDFINALPHLQHFFCKKVLSNDRSPEMAHQNLNKVRNATENEAVNGQYDVFYQPLQVNHP